jgi:acyl-coenzyme A thioesterase PaaI-like protein
VSTTAALLARFKALPYGLALFSRAVCFKAPYFATIRPVFTRLEPGHGEAGFRKRRAVQNHLGTVHAIALANLCELVAGTTLEITLPPTHRWIPKGMTIKYLAKATTDVRARTSIALGELADAGSHEVVVEVFDEGGTMVVTAAIEMYVSRRSKR